MLSIYGDRSVVLVRELTKIYEEYQRGRISEVINSVLGNPLKGECLLIVEGFKEEEVEQSEADLLAEVDLLVASGAKKNQAIKEVAKKYGWNKSELYARYHEQISE